MRLDMCKSCYFQFFLEFGIVATCETLRTIALTDGVDVAIRVTNRSVNLG